MDNQDIAGAEDQQQEEGAGSEQGTEGSEQGQSAHQREEGKDYFEPFQDQQRRAAKAEKDAKTYKQQLIEAGVLDKDGKPKQKPSASQEQGSSSSQSSDDVVRARLDARGVLDEDEQDAVIEAAKVLNISPIKALENDIVKGKLAGIRAQKATAAATPAPSRGGGTTTNIARLADKAQETGELPSDPKLKAQVKEELKRRSSK